LHVLKKLAIENRQDVDRWLDGAEWRLRGRGGWFCAKINHLFLRFGWFLHKINRAIYIIAVYTKKGDQNSRVNDTTRILFGGLLNET